MIGKWSKMDWCRLSGGTNQLFIRKRYTLSCVVFFNLPHHALNLISFYIVALSCTVAYIVGLQIFFIPIVFIIKMRTIVCCIEYRYLSEFK